MKILLLGASGMVGQGVLRECELASDVGEIVSLVRRPSASRGPKVREVVVADMFDLASAKEDLRGVDACFFCLGVSSAGMIEADYRRVTYDLTLAVARALHELSPQATFVYVSGASTDSTEKGSSMWARVKGKTENELLALFENACMFRPGLIRPLHGIRPRSTAYRLAYTALWPLMPLARAFFPNKVATTEIVGRAMLVVARKRPDRRVLESADIIALGADAPA